MIDRTERGYKYVMAAIESDLCACMFLYIYLFTDSSVLTINTATSNERDYT
jgi:hypothetical protein